MTQKLTLAADYPIAQAELFRLLTDIEFVKRRMLDEPGCVSVTPEELQRDDNRIAFKMAREVYARTITGQDRSKTEREGVLFEFDPRDFSGSWRVVEHPQHGRFQLTCAMRVDKAGDGAREVRDHEITVSVPLLGKRIEKKIKEGFERAWPERVAWLKQQIASA